MADKPSTTPVADEPVEREEYTAKQIATRIGTDAKTLRKFFRSSHSTVEPVGQGGRYVFDAADLPKIKEEFEKYGKEKPTRAPAGSGKTTKSKGRQAPAAAEVIEDDDELLELDEEPTDEELLELDDEVDADDIEEFDEDDEPLEEDDDEVESNGDEAGELSREERETALNDMNVKELKSLARSDDYKLKITGQPKAGIVALILEKEYGALNPEVDDDEELLEDDDDIEELDD